MACRPDAGIPGSSRPFIPLPDINDIPAVVTRNKAWCIIVRAVIDDDQLEVWIGLGHNRVNRLSQMVLPVKCWNNDADKFFHFQNIYFSCITT